MTCNAKPLTPLDLENEIDGLICEAEQLLFALARLLDTLDDKEERAPLLGVTYAALDKIRAAIELIELKDRALAKTG